MPDLTTLSLLDLCAVEGDAAGVRAELQRRQAMLARVERLEAALRAAEDAMCRATFDLKGRNCRDLNHAIDKARAALGERPAR